MSKQVATNYSMESRKFDFIKKKLVYPSVSAVMLCKQFSAYNEHIDCCNHVFKNIQVGPNTYVLATRTFMF